MLSFHDPRAGLGRREFLRIGGLGLGGLTLPWLLQAQGQTGPARSRLTTDKSVIFLFLHGGPTQIETFDPKMSAPEGIRSVNGEIPTSLPGVTFGSGFPRLARLADRFAVVRSYRPGDASHDIKPIVHREFLNANLGSIYSRVAGANHPVTAMPTNVALFPRAVDEKAQPAQTGFGSFLSTGTVGSSHAPFVPGGNSDFQKNLSLRLPADRLEDRRRLLSHFDTLRRDLDNSGTIESLDHFQQQAAEVILRGVGQAFDLSREDPATVARYDTRPLFTPDKVSKRNNHKFYVDNVNTLGKLLLYARRLCEAGAGFVTVTTNFVWDMHADGNNAPVGEAIPFVGGPLDHALSAYIEDVEARGLSERILLVACGEMGRTPRVNKNGGRDHWGNLGPLLLHGGGLKMGQVVGCSTANAGEPATAPVTMGHLVGTIMNTLFNVGELRVARGIPDDVLRVTTLNEPIAELF